MIRKVFKIPQKKFSDYDKSQTKVQAKIGDHILSVAHKNDIDIEGACDAQLACSTCHVILEEELYDSLEEPDLREEDLLDMAYGLTPMSRLGCQVYVTKEFDGTKITLPQATRNFYVDGFTPKPHQLNNQLFIKNQVNFKAFYLLMINHVLNILFQLSNNNLNLEVLILFIHLSKLNVLVNNHNQQN